VAVALDERKRAILSAVVEHYIATGRPVSSAWVTERGDLGVCSATIRGEMSELEQAGYLDHPHTSAGRVPTDYGYRVYAETVMSQVEPARDPGPFAGLAGRGEIEAALEATCRQLARLTRYLSLAQAPSWRNEKLRHLQLARLDAHRVLAVVLTQSGRVHHALLDSGRLPTPEQLRALAALINDRCAGRTLGELTREPLNQAVRELWPHRSFTDRAVDLISASIPRTDDSPLVVEGGSRLLEQWEFREAAVARQVFGLIEEQSHLRALLAHQSAGLSVTIGEETGHPALRHCALMAATFQAPGGATGHIAVLGPKRMRYRPVISALLLAARTLGAALAGAPGK